ncbi:MAG: branched-chain amino acid ABC transporter permease [Paracoccaceae bacterium]
MRAGNWLPWVLAAGWAAALPFLFPGGGAVTILNQMAITIVFALSYNMLLGQGGMLSFGHAVYMGLGGYGAVHLMRAIETDAWALPLPLVPLVAGLAGLAFAALAGLVSLRRAGTTFAMISLGVAELAVALAVILVTTFGGEGGISADRTMGPAVLGSQWFTAHEVYWLVAGWTFVSALLMYLFTKTPAGRLANAVRDNAQRASFIGVSPMRARFVSFCMAGFFAGIAGGLLAINLEIVTDEALGLQTSGEILLITFLGGTGHFAGPVLGAILFTLVKTVLGLETPLWGLYTGLMFLALVMFAPGGLAGIIAAHRAPAALGRIAWLVVPYLRTGVPALAAIIGVAGMMELAMHLRESGQGDNAITLFWLAMDASSIWSWATFAALALIGGSLALRTWPEARDAWEEASTQ